jgi:hypothetical protein
MSTFEEAEILGLPTEHVGGGCKPLEVLRSQGIGSLRRGETRVRLAPGLRRMGIATPFQLGHGNHHGAIIARGSPFRPRLPAARASERPELWLRSGGRRVGR